MVTSGSPAFTSAPSRKWIASTAPATRGRISTRLTASSRPENSSHVATSRRATTATETGVAGGAVGGVGPLVSATDVVAAQIASVPARTTLVTPISFTGKEEICMMNRPTYVTVATYVALDVRFK